MLTSGGVIYSSSEFSIPISSPGAPNPVSVTPGYLNGGILYLNTPINDDIVVTVNLPSAADIVAFYPALKVGNVLSFDVIVSQDNSIVPPPGSNADITGVAVVAGTGGTAVCKAAAISGYFITNVPWDGDGTDSPSAGTFINSHKFRVVMTNVTPGSEAYNLY